MHDRYETRLERRPDEGLPGAESRRFQFRLRTLLIVITILCVFFAIPAVTWALGVIAAWYAFGFLALGLVILFQFPIFLLLKRWSLLPDRNDASIAGRDEDTSSSIQ